MTDTTARWALDLIHPGQAQKEMAHNEALAKVDLLLQPRVVSAGLDAPPAAPEPGQCWIVGAAPTDVWSGQAYALAGWDSSGWRFVTPVDGIQIWVEDRAEFAQFLDGEWIFGELRGKVIVEGSQIVGPRQAAIADPAGGAIADSEARAAIVAILAAMRTHGLIERL